MSFGDIDIHVEPGQKVWAPSQKGYDPNRHASLFEVEEVLEHDVVLNDGRTVDKRLIQQDHNPTARWYLKPYTSSCYDKTGWTYPEKKAFDFEAAIKEAGGTNIEWESREAGEQDYVCFDYPLNKRPHVGLPNGSAYESAHWIDKFFDIVAFVRDDTEYWRLDDELMEHIEAIYTVYVFNRHKVTHICSMSGSYEVWPAYPEFVLKDDTPDEISSKVFDELNTHFDYDPMYFAERDVEHIIEQEPEMVYDDPEKYLGIDGGMMQIVGLYNEWWGAGSFSWDPEYGWR